MEIRNDEKTYIIAPLSQKLDQRECARIFSKFDSAEQSNIAIDLLYIKDCTIDFIETLKEYSLEHNISAFNIPSDIFVLFNFMGIDKYVKLFVSELDFENNSRQLINRVFKVA